MPTDLLTAVNIVLAAVGESPVNSLAGERTEDVSRAVALLNEQASEFQSSGWSFNTEYEYTLALDNDNRIPIPKNATTIVFSALDRSKFNPVVRGEKLYDSKNHTEVFAANLIAEKIIFTFPFETMPEPARRYVAVRSARLFEQQIMGDTKQQEVLAEQERKAWLDWERHETDVTQPNIFNSPEHQQLAYFRGQR